MTEALDVAAEYVAGLADGVSARMDAVRAEGFVLDWVHGDAFERPPISREQAEGFWPAWFAAFSELDLEVTRTIAAEEVVVVQWDARRALDSARSFMPGRC